ncbi:hypothetical protein A9Q81_25820 [Gammaproteobacteria bacterium 42_54_T18]|nr:hypothetical protein A9Q81_25820 [Gammaproteobacteria bacterium 42_54_T18]
MLGFGSKPRVCIVGAGFAGLNAAQQLKSSKYDVTVIDSEPFIEWLPNLHEIISGRKDGDELRLSRKRIIARLGHRFCQNTVVDISCTSLMLDSGDMIAFDACVVATGGLDDFSGVSGAKQFAYSAKSVAGCQHIAKVMRRATLGHRTLKVTVVGAGAEGVEVLGEALRAYRYRPQFEFQMVDASKHILPQCAGNLDNAVRRHVEKLSVDFCMGNGVTSVEKEGLYLQNGEAIASDLTIWAAGVLPTPLLNVPAHEAAAPRQWGRVSNTFQSHRFESVFVVGDAADMPPIMAKEAFHAIDMGRFVAMNVERLLSGKRLKRFDPTTKPQVVSFGDLDTFMVFNGFSVSSSMLGAAKEMVYTLGLLQLSPPTNPKDFVNALDVFQRSMRRVYLPTLNPVSIVGKLTRARLLT